MLRLEVYTSRLFTVLYVEEPVITEATHVSFVQSPTLRKPRPCLSLACGPDIGGIRGCFAARPPQGLKKMEGLCLPGLRELYLHQNKITKIEGLHG